VQRARISPRTQPGGELRSAEVILHKGTASALAPRPDAGGAAGDWAADPISRSSLKWLHRALHRTTEVLASELGRPTASAPDWSETEWAVARAVAAIHGVSALLAGALRWRGPAAWAQFLAEQRSHTVRRFVRIEELLQQIDHRARREGVALVALKGAALHASGIYTAGERPMADVDLLVRAAEEQPAVQLLGTLGFREAYRSWRHRVFEPEMSTAPEALGEHCANAIKIELHCRIGERLPLRPVEVSQLIFPQPAFPGLNSYGSRAGLLIHLLLHAAGALCFRELRLLHLHDIARLAARMTEEDWEEVLLQAARTADGSLWWAFPPLTLVTRYYSCVPDRVLAYAASGCHWPLRRVYRHRALAEASLSHLWISAFPGIEWARSPEEILAYAAARVVPSGATVRMRRALANVQPRVSGGQWAQLSQTRRVLRWLTSPQARYETLQPVRAALRAAS
jgi:putative nucleotidyltransferase-like protein